MRTPEPNADWMVLGLYLLALIALVVAGWGAVAGGRDGPILGGLSAALTLWWMGRVLQVVLELRDR